MTPQQLFELGMKRSVPDLIPFGPVTINLGAGASPLAGALNLDFPEWDGERDGIPVPDGTVDSVVAFHFFEHFSGANAMRLLRECERVLKVGGTLTAVTPHRLSQMAYHDLDHKSVWTEETWRVLFATPYYRKNRETAWRLEPRFNMIMGLNERNLALVSQLVRVERGAYE